MTEDKELTEDCYGMGRMDNMTPPRPWLAHPVHDWVRTDATDPTDAGDTLIVCLTCCKTDWVKTTKKIGALPLESDETWENRKHKCGDNHWVRTE